MAKRYVEECDLCKKEAELDNSLTLKPNKSKKAGRSYDLCNTCKELLEKALVSREGLAVLRPSVPVSRAHAPENPEAMVNDPNSLTLDDGSTRPIPTRTEIQKGNDDSPGTFETQPLPQIVDQDTGEKCLHMNRSRPRIFEDSNKVELECRDCGTRLPYRSSRMKARELNTRGHDGVSLKTHASEERKGRDD
jgi:hypothetical protein